MLDTILNHRTIRKYKNTPIEDHKLQEVLNAATRASTTGNMQVYSVIVTKNKAKKEALWASHFKQNMVLEAPVVLTFCADFNRFNKWCADRKADAGYDNFLSFYTASIDALLAAQNAALEAENQGLGICYLGTTTYMAEKIIDILELPKGVVPVTTVVVGYPDENPPLTDRLPLYAVVHYETYKEFSSDEINKLYSEKESLESSKQFVAENNKQSLAQVFTDIRYKKADNVHFSKEFLRIIEKQGFMKNEM